MAELLGATEALFNTDFSIVNAQQEAGGPAPGSFAGSTTGGVAGMAGTKYANVAARAERWTARPEYNNSWEDIDELPFVAIKDGGPLRLQGFDESDAEGLDLRGFESGRVVVMARGRHRYNYSSEPARVDSLPPEEWLFRFFPTVGPPRPLDGGPRRIAGVAPFLSGTRKQIDIGDFRLLAEDIRLALMWVPKTGLQTTVREMAIRWSTSPFEVRGALELLGLISDHDAPRTDNDEALDDAPIHLTGR